MLRQKTIKKNSQILKYESETIDKGVNPYSDSDEVV